MNGDPYSRFIFIGFDDLKKIKFDKLEQVCDKVFVFVNREEKAIPFSLVQQLQKLGESVQWVAIGGVGEKSNCHFLSFHLGLAHEQIEEDVEFAIISEDISIDPLISYMNEMGRNAVRVTNNREKDGHTSDLNGINWSTKGEDVVQAKEKVEIVKPVEREKRVIPPAVKITNGTNGTSTNGHSTKESEPAIASSSVNQQLSERIARETVKRLVMSGNRPAAVDSLKSYILLQYNNAEVNRHIDLIIRKLEKSNEIQLKDKEVHYNF